VPERAEVEVTKNDISAITSNWQLIGYKILCDKISINESQLENAIQSHDNHLEWSCWGKRIVLRIGDYENAPHLIFGLGMTGSFTIKEADWYDKKQHPRFSLIYRDGSKIKQLVFCDVRKFGKVFFRDKEDDFPKMWVFDIGPGKYPENIRIATFEKLLNRCVITRRVNKPIKSFLLDQNEFGGYGNYMACEVLFRANIHPETKVRDLTTENISNIRKETFELIDEMISLGGVTLKDFVRPNGKYGKGIENLKVYGRRNKPCLRCNDSIEYIKLSGRGTFYCPSCQPSLITIGK